MKRIACVGMLLFVMGTTHSMAADQTPAQQWETIVAEATKGGYRLILPEELKREHSAEGSAFVFVDVRQKWAFQMQHVKGALHLDFEPTWWNRYSPVMRADMRKLLGSETGRKLVFY